MERRSRLRLLVSSDVFVVGLPFRSGAQLGLLDLAWQRSASGRICSSPLGVLALPILEAQFAPNPGGPMD